VVSLDLIISVVLLMLFIGIIIIFFPQEADAGADYRHGSQVMTDLENLQSTNPTIAFYSNYRIDNGRLASFASLPYSSTPQQPTDQKFLLIGTSDYYAIDNDVCLFFLDGAGVQLIQGMQALGRTYDTADQTSRGPCLVNDPCRYYTNAHAFSRPVLRNGRIVNMYIVVCEA
jgi:hypothetical protein